MPFMLTIKTPEFVSPTSLKIAHYPAKFPGLHNSFAGFTTNQLIYFYVYLRPTSGYSSQLPLSDKWEKCKAAQRSCKN
jgi:hypothetical protein